jgi:hypothetical protein
MDKLNRILCIAMLVAALPSAGCYTYSTARVEDVPLQARVRARLTAVESDRQWETTGVERRTIRGKLVERTPGNVTLAVAVPSATMTGTEPGLEQRIRVPLTGIQKMELLRVNVARTAGLVTLIAAGMGYVLYEAFIRDTYQAPPSEGGPPPNQVRIGVSIPSGWR